MEVNKALKLLGYRNSQVVHQMLYQPAPLANSQSHRRQCRYSSRKSNVSKASTPEGLASAAIKSKTVSLPNPSNMPVFRKVPEFRNKVAVCDLGGSFLYDDIFRRSIKLSETIRSELKSKTNENIAIFCPNGVSYVIAEWACWMSGNVAVPLAKEQSLDEVKFVLKDAKCSLVLTTDLKLSRVKDMTAKLQIPVVAIEQELISSPLKPFENEDPLPDGMLDDSLYAPEQTALILYTKSENPKPVSFTHTQLNAQMNIVSAGWDLNSKCSLLHALPLNRAYGNVTAMMTPLSVGGKVVLLSSFDTIRVWSHLLGIPVGKSTQTLPKVNLFPSLPNQFEKLLNRYRETFVEKKQQEYVKRQCRKRVRAMFNSCHQPLPVQLRKDWLEITGHPVVDCYTSTKTGTVLSGSIPTELQLKRSEDSAPFVMAMPGIQTRIVRSKEDKKRSKSNVRKGDLMLKSPGQSDSDVTKDGWIWTNDEAELEDGKIKVL